MEKGKLYLVPTPIGINSLISDQVKELVCVTRHFIVETEKDARRFLKLCGYDLKNHYPEFYLLNEHNAHQSFEEYMRPIQQGLNMVLMSDAGIPCVADPGYQVVKLCHQKEIEVLPFVGSSSIFLALMSSGFTGQSFTFHGYLPVDKPARVAKLKHLEMDIIKNGATQLFIETPYRNNQLLADLLTNLPAERLLCIAIDLEGEGQRIKTLPIKTWKTTAVVLDKSPAVFILGK
ncbi:MAG: SAM-dependent methyltransferase [Bacteroidetes bacterium]|nr:SAM-dependent methyltransferase [Bacteroidota bacterium]